MCQSSFKALYTYELVYSIQQSYETGTVVISSILQMGKLRPRKAEELAGRHMNTRQSGAHHLVPPFNRE